MEAAASGHPRAGRMLRAAIGLVVLFLAFFVVSTRPVEHGGRTPESWALATIGLGLLVTAFAYGTPWQLAAFSIEFLVFGLIGQLGMTNPLWLQHLKLSGTERTGFDLLFMFLVAAQAMAACVSAWMFRPLVREVWPRGLLGRIRPRHWVLGAVIFGACAVHLTRYVNKPQFAALSYAAQLAITAGFLAINLLNLVVIAALVPLPHLRAIRDRFLGTGVQRPAKAGGPNGLHVDWHRTLPWILAGWTFVASLLLGWVALDQVPHIPDEVCYVFQAECLARGIFWGQAPPNPDAFKVYLVPAENGRWFATTSPGWPALLALGSAIGAPWIVNPILGALGVLLAHALTRRLLGMNAAHLAAFLLAVSPWLLYLSGSYMTHPASLALMLAAWLCIAKGRERPIELPGPDGPPRQPHPAKAPLWSLLGGALMGWLFLVRQLDAVLVGGIMGLWMLGLFGRRMPWAAIVAFVAGFGGVAALILPYNAMMTGNPFTFPLNAYMDGLWYPGINRLGFGADIGNPTGGWGDLDPFPGHGLRDVLINTNQNLYATNFELFGWCIGSLFFVVVHLLFARESAIDRLMLLTIVLLLLGYNLYWFSGGSDFGARYWYLMIYPLVLLTVRGIGTAASLAADGPAGDTAPERIGAIVGVLAFTTLAVFIPWRAVTRYQDYRGFHADYRKLEKSLDPKSLVFVKSKASEKGMQGDADYSSAFIRNSPRQDEARPIFAQDLGDAENRKLIAAFPDRRVVYVTGRSMGTGPTRVETEATSRPR